MFSTDHVRQLRRNRLENLVFEFSKSVKSIIGGEDSVAKLFIRRSGGNAIE